MPATLVVNRTESGALPVVGEAEKELVGCETAVQLIFVHPFESVDVFVEYPDGHAL